MSRRHCCVRKRAVARRRCCDCWLKMALDSHQLDSRTVQAGRRAPLRLRVDCRLALGCFVQQAVATLVVAAVR